MVYFSQLKGKPVIDSQGKKIGVIKDLVFSDGMDYAQVTHLIYLSKDRYRKKIAWRFIKEIKEAPKKEDIEIHLNTSLDDLNILFEKESDLLVSSLVDKQIVDVDGQKIVRVNDVLLGKIGDKFCVVAVCVGTRSLLRVLGIKGGDKLAAKEKIIPWASVETLEKDLHDLHLRYQKSKIADLHPSDIADIIEDLSHDERVLIFNSLGKKKAAKTLIEVEPDVQSSFLKNLKMARIVEILEDMPPNEAADILSLMPKRRTNSILNSMKSEKAKKIREILKYPEESAGSIMHTEFVAIPQHYTAQQTINLLRKLKPVSEKIYHLYVVDKKKHLIGVLSIRSLLTAPPKEVISNFMRTRIAKVRLNTSKKDVAHALTKYNLFALPVVDNNNVLKGIVKADEVLEEIMPKSWKKGNYRR
jgi:flagellar motility protein MotE (MotC chaperone)/uncharacterized protein YrrD